MHLNSVIFICREIVSLSSMFLAVELFRSTFGVSSRLSLCTVNVGWRREWVSGEGKGASNSQNEGEEVSAGETLQRGSLRPGSAFSETAFP